MEDCMIEEPCGACHRVMCNCPPEMEQCQSCNGNGNYLGQDFEGVQWCPDCKGTGEVSA